MDKRDTCHKEGGEAGNTSWKWEARRKTKMYVVYGCASEEQIAEMQTSYEVVTEISGSQVQENR